MKKGDCIELLIDDLVYGGRGVARKDEFVWFVDGGLPGQTVQAVVRRRRKSYGEARVREVIEPGPDQIEAPCPYFGICGGCQLQHLKYEAQVAAKTRQVRDILTRIGQLSGDPVQETRPAEQIYGYRNKMEFTFSDRPWVIQDRDEDKPEDFALGLHVPGRFDKVLDIDACLLQSETANQLLRDVRDLVLKTELPPYRVQDHAGFWRFLVIREGKQTSDLFMKVITSSQAPQRGKPAFEWLMHKLFWNHLELTGVIHGISDKKAQVAFSESETLVLGDGRLREQVGSCMYEISSDAFFQTNTGQTKVLFDTIIELAGFSGNEIVYDLYCGTGAIGIYIARHVKQVVGIEAIPAAVEDGNRNVELNNLGNVHLMTGDMMDAIHDTHALTGKFGAADVVILDPPRGGTHPGTIRDLLSWKPPCIIYVSCNPPMLAKDLTELQTLYRVEAVQPVDMFPHTKHIEVVCVLRRK
ncbi:23S rRNA (uracil(1939)-C(5))-methyltransferase RlmD [bacterium]|nr:23S rRNA (uracil(1939)-C(5))-methyltransferase RlmD [bacterium]